MPIQRWDVADIMRQLRAITAWCNDPHNDGWTQSGCKQDLYHIKCFIEDTYPTLPTFVGEEKWEQERIVQKLRQ